MVAIRGEFDGDDESGLVLRPHSEFGFEPLFVSDNGAANRPGDPELQGQPDRAVAWCSNKLF